MEERRDKVRGEAGEIFVETTRAQNIMQAELNLLSGILASPFNGP